MAANPTTTTDNAKQVDLPQNLTVDEASRMEAALMRRHGCESEITRVMREALPNCCRTLAGGITIESDTYAELRELLAEWAVANRDFEAAVFKRQPKQLPKPDLRDDDLVAATEGGAR